LIACPSLPRSQPGKPLRRRAGGVLLVIVVATLVFYLRRHMKRLERKAEQACPGPLDDAGSASGAPARGHRR
jgi:hypothetical protein